MLLCQSSLHVTQFCVAIGHSGACLYGVRAFLGRVRYNTRTNEHVASVIRVVLDRQVAWGVVIREKQLYQITSPINTPSNKTNNGMEQTTGNANDQ